MTHEIRCFLSGQSGSSRQKLLLSVLCWASCLAVRAGPDGNATIRAPVGGSEIVIKTTARTAGAIDSLTWKGREFINSHDHGRQLQSASNLDAGSPITAETFNPTEAGSRSDGRGPNTSSQLLFMQAASNDLQTTSKMAFWLAPGEKSGPNLAKNTTVLSQHLLKKHVVIGYKNMPHVIAYDVTFTLPRGERHTHAVFEALTGYMPPEFAQFFTLDSPTGELEPLSDGPGEVSKPIVFATSDGAHAMGIYAPPQSVPNMTGPSYGRWRFKAEKVVKWNCVFRVLNPQDVAPGDYAFRMFVAIGDRATVRDSLRALYQEFKDAK